MVATGHLAKTITPLTPLRPQHLAVPLVGSTRHRTHWLVLVWFGVHLRFGILR